LKKKKHQTNKQTNKQTTTSDLTKKSKSKFDPDRLYSSLAALHLYLQRYAEHRLLCWQNSDRESGTVLDG
jgi:hypothetical protein